MSLFKKSKTDTKTEENKDIDFLKQSINCDIEEKPSRAGDKLPKLSDILGNKPDVKSKLSDINFEAITIEDRNKGNVTGDNKSDQTNQKPDVGAVRAALESAIKEQAAAAAAAKLVAQATPAKPPAAASTPVAKPVTQASPVNSPAAASTPVAKPVAQATPVNPPAAATTLVAKPVTQATPVNPPAAATTPVAKPVVQATPVNPPAAASTPVAKPVVQASPVNSPAAASTPVAKPVAQATSGIPQESLKEIHVQLDNQKKLIDEQNKVIKNLESTIKKVESEDVDKLVKQNQDLLKQLTERMDAVEERKLTETEDVLSDEEQALIKAGKYLENHLQKVNDVYDKLDNKITDMRKFMTEVDEKERKFMETEDKLNIIQRKAESIIESELLSKSNEAVKNLQDNKTKIVEESEKLLAEVEKKLENFKYEIESFKEKSKTSINETSELLKVTEYEVKKAIDQKREYDRENMKRVDEVISIMNETVRKILGKEENNN
ncbi:MAG: hypothetical protein K0A89_10295 [ANME-2 cluster archaeon]|nr:hypothetical protein [ANME-2 cluster archaeon]